jgi:hypothetical protein
VTPPLQVYSAGRERAGGEGRRAGAVARPRQHPDPAGAAGGAAERTRRHRPRLPACAGGIDINMANICI